MSLAGWLGASALVLLAVAAGAWLVVIGYAAYSYLRLPPLESLANVIDEYTQLPDERDRNGESFPAVVRGACIAKPSLTILDVDPADAHAGWLQDGAIPEAVDLPFTHVSEVLHGGCAAAAGDAASLSAGPSTESGAPSRGSAPNLPASAVRVPRRAGESSAARRRPARSRTPVRCG